MSAWCFWCARFLALSIILLTGSTIFAQSGASTNRSTVVITPLLAPRDDPVAVELARTITASLALDLRLSRSVKLETADFLVPTYSLRASVNYYRQVGAKAAVFGKVLPRSSGSYVVQVDIWTTGRSHASPRHVSGTISEVLNAFQFSDALALKVASSIVGRPLHDGILVIENRSGLSHFSVYADGQLLGRNRTTFRLLTGKHQIIVAKPGLLGDVPVKVVKLTIAAKTPQVVTVGASKPAQPVGPRTTPPPARSRAKAPAPASAQTNSSVIRIPPQTKSLLGTVYVTTMAAGTFTIDGRHPIALGADGSTTVGSLSPGIHRFTMRYKDGSIEVRNVTVESARTVDLSFDLDLSYK